MPQTQDVVSLVRAAAKRYGVDPNFAHSILIAEGWSPTTQTSSAGAAGPMQIMPDTARGLGLRVGGGVDERYDVPKNIDAGVRYLSQLSKQYGGDPALTAMAYNGGGGAVQAFRAGQLASYGKGETQRYINKVIPTFRRLTVQGGGGDYKTVDNNTGTGTVAPRPAAAGARAPRATPNQDAYAEGLKRDMASVQSELNDKKAALAQLDKDRQAAIAAIRSGQENVTPPSSSQTAFLKTEIQRLEGALRTKSNAYDAYVGRQATRADTAAAAGPKGSVVRTRGPRGTTVRTSVSGTPEEVAAASDQLGDGSDMASDSGVMTDYQDAQVGLKGRQLDQKDQELQLEQVKAAYAEHKLTYDKAVTLIDKILNAPSVSTVGGKRYVAGYEPGSGMIGFAKGYGINLDPKEYTDIDYAGLLGISDANKYVHSSANPFTEKSLTAEQVNSGDYRPGGPKALPSMDQGGANVLKPPGETAAGAGEDAGPGDALNAVNPEPGEVSQTPPIPPAGAPGGATQAQVESNVYPPKPVPPRRDIGSIAPAGGPNAIESNLTPRVPGAQLGPPTNFPPVQKGMENFPPAARSVPTPSGGGAYNDLINGGPQVPQPPVPGSTRVEPASRPSTSTPNTLEPPGNLGMEDSGLGPPTAAPAGPAMPQEPDESQPIQAGMRGPPAQPGQLASAPGDDNHAKIVQALIQAGAPPQVAEEEARKWWQREGGQAAA